MTEAIFFFFLYTVLIVWFKVNNMLYLCYSDKFPYQSHDMDHKLIESKISEEEKEKIKPIVLNVILVWV